MMTVFTWFCFLLVRGDIVGTPICNNSVSGERAELKVDYYMIEMNHFAEELQEINGKVLYSGKWVQIPLGFGGRFALDLRVFKRIWYLKSVHLFYPLTTKYPDFLKLVCQDFWLRHYILALTRKAMYQ